MKPDYEWWEFLVGLGIAVFILVFATYCFFNVVGR